LVFKAKTKLEEALDPLTRLALLGARVGGAGVIRLLRRGSEEARILFPTFGELAEDYMRLRGACSGGDADLERPLTNEEVKRMRYRTSADRWLAHLGPRWGPALTIFYRHLPARIKRPMKRLWDHLGVHRATNEARLAEGFKKLSSLAKRGRNLLFDGWWKECQYLELQGGYKAEVGIEAFSEEIEDWMTGQVSHTLEGSEDLFLDYFGRGASNFLGLAPYPKVDDDRVSTIREWAENPNNWATAGSSSDRNRLMVMLDGRVVKARKGKWATALILSPKVVEAMILTPAPQMNKALQKRELGKVRAVINSDLGLYFKMSYVSHWLEQAMREHPGTTLFYTSKQMLELWTNLSVTAADNHVVKMPLDQSHFDWQENFRMLLVVMKAIRAFAQRWAPLRIRDDIIRVIDLVAIAITSGTVQVGRRFITIMKGIASGWRWTAFLDTIVNWSEIYTAEEYVKDKTGVVCVLEKQTQGDDVRSVTPGEGQAFAIWETFVSMGFDVNPGKFFISRTEDEFLRQVGRAGNTSGYYGRAIPSLMWRNPVSRDPPSGLSRAREQVKGWMTFHARGADFETVVQDLVVDIEKANGLSFDTVRRWLATPASLGGAGLFRSLETVGVEMIQGTQVRLGRVVSGLPGIAKYLEEAKTYGVPQYDINQWALGLVDVKGNIVSKRNAEFRFVTIPIVKRARAIDFARTKGVSLRPRWVHDLEINPLHNLILTHLVREKDWAMIRELLDPGYRGISDAVERKGGRRVWVDWLLGRLPFSQPTVPGWSELAVSVWFDAAVIDAWSRLMSKYAFNMTNVRKAAVVCELSVREALGGRQPVIGG